jgi:hypothetical protein
MSDPLDLALHSYRFWRDIGADALIIALLIEFLIEAYWPEHPERKHLKLSRKQAMTTAAFFVLAGVAVERLWGTKADDKSDKIRINLAQRLEGEQRKTTELEYEIDRFPKGRHVSIESSHSRLCCPIPPSAVLIQNVAGDPEADELAGEIGSAVQFSWHGTRRVDALDTNVTNIDDGVAIYCAECGSPSTSEGTARTAEQIRDLLMGWPNEVATKVLPLDSLNVLLPSSFPKGAILILVGKDSLPFDVSVFVAGPPENHAFLDTLAKMPARYRPSMMRGYLPKPTKP